MRQRSLGLAFVLALLVAGTAPAWAQPPTASVRLAALLQWVVNQHRQAVIRAPGQPLAPEFRSALDGGVVDRVVFWWQRGAIQRRSLVAKPIRVLPAAEATALGGRGDFELVSVRPPAGGSAWTEVEVGLRSAGTDDVLVLEIGGELHTIAQVLESLFVAVPGDGLRELALARRAVIPGDGVPVFALPFGEPVVLAGGPPPFRGVAGAEFFVARSQVEVIENAAVTTNGPADLAGVMGAGRDWREADRVFVRIPVAALRTGAPAVVLGWKDRTFRSDGGDTDFRQRARLGVPLLR